MSKAQYKDGVAGLKVVEMKTHSIVFMIYCLVAAGAFGIEEMISASGPGMTILMLCLFPVLWALPISEMVAELGSVLPSEGGAYVWTREGLGEFWGWQVGFWGTIGTWLSQATYVVLIVGYTEKFIPMTEMHSYMLKLAIVILFTVVNLLGVKEVSAVSTILSLLVLIGFAGVTVVGFANWHYNPVAPFMPEGQGLIESIGGSICICIWMYCGYESVSNLAGEVKNPQIIPRGLIIAMPLIALSYVLPTLAGVASVGQWQNWATEGEGAVGYMDVLFNYLGPAFGILFLIVAILSNCSIFNIYIASGSRGFFVMADDFLFPRFMVKVSKRRGVPHVSILLMAAFTMVLCKLDFTTLVMATTPLMLYLYMALSISTRRIRKKYPVEDRKRKGLFVIPGGQAGLNYMTALPFVISIVALLVNGTEYFICGFILLFIGLAGYIVCKIAYGGLYRIDPIRYPVNPVTRLAEGDGVRIGYFVLFCGIASVIGAMFLFLYEGEWGPEYYLDTYETGLFSNFDGMIHLLLIGGVIALLLGAAAMIAGRKIEKHAKAQTGDQTVLQ